MNLLLAAFPPELGPWLQNPPAGWRAACTGVGPLAGAVETTRALLAWKPERVLFLGTCGSYRSDLPIGAVVSVRQVVDRTIAEGRKEAYRPSLQRSEWDADLLPPFPPVVCVATPAITSSAEAARLMGAQGAVEHLELAGVFEAAARLNVPVGAVLGVANAVGPTAQDEWKASHRSVSESVRQQLIESGWLTAGIQEPTGMP